jgi:hypothetical protein
MAQLTSRRPTKSQLLEKNGMLAEVTRKLVSRGDDPEAFNLMHTLVRLVAADQEANGLIEANFEDWRANGLPDREDEMKPWQKKAKALSTEVLSLRAQAEKERK